MRTFKLYYKFPIFSTNVFQEGNSSGSNVLMDNCATVVSAGCRDSVGEWRRLPGPRLQVRPWRLCLELLWKKWAVSFQNHKSGSETQKGQLCLVYLLVTCFCQQTIKHLSGVTSYLFFKNKKKRKKFFLHFLKDATSNFHLLIKSLINVESWILVASTY